MLRIWESVSSPGEEGVVGSVADAGVGVEGGVWLDWLWMLRRVRKSREITITG